MRPIHAIGASMLLLAANLVAQEGSMPSLAKAMEKVIKELDLDGAGLTVVSEGTLLHRSTHGNVAGETVLPIASASKWLAVATILTLVEQKKLDLDVPVARYVEEFDRPDKRMLTLRQCLSCTAGLPPQMSDRMRDWDMDRFAKEAASAGLKAHPGSAFRYGGVGFQVAAVAAERVSGKRWHELFAERIAVPLEMTNTKFSALQPPGGDAGTTPLPWVASGAETTLDDYTRFVRMLVNRGELDGRRVLSEASVTAMWRDQVRENVDVRAAGFDADNMRYGLGTWIEQLDDGVVRVADPGAFGFTPWFDLDLGVGGVFAVRDNARRVLEELEPVQEEVRRVATSAAIIGTTAHATLAHGGRDRRYELLLPPKAENHPGLPLLLVLHAGGSSAVQAREITRLGEFGVRAGFAVAFADGTGPLRGRQLTWNSGGAPVYAVKHDVDDVGFLRAVVADARTRAPIDASRVFVVGHDNGAMMCHRLAREAADVFAGIAAVAGAMTFTKVDAEKPIAVLIVDGTAPAKKAGERREAAQTAVDYYVQRNGLAGSPETEQDGKICTVTYAGNPGHTLQPVRVITLEGGGTAWPGAKVRRSEGDAPFPFDATRAVVTFFASLTAVPPVAAPTTPR